MNIDYKRFDTLDYKRFNKFSKYENQFFQILSNAYTVYYGNEYHKERIINGKAIVYLGFVDNVLVGVSYVKRNLRRGGTAVFPKKFRRLGLAENLVKLSFKDFPKQYTILSTDLEHSYKMFSLMKKLGFKQATNESEIKMIVGNEFSLLSNFRLYNGYFIFDRESEKRGAKRELLTLMHNFF